MTRHYSHNIELTLSIELLEIQVDTDCQIEETTEVDLRWCLWWDCFHNTKFELIDSTELTEIFLCKWLVVVTTRPVCEWVFQVDTDWKIKKKFLPLAKSKLNKKIPLQSAKSKLSAIHVELLISSQTTPGYKLPQQKNSRHFSIYTFKLWLA